MTKIDFKTSDYFPGIVMASSAVFTFVGTIVLFVNLVVGVVLLLMSIVILTTRYRIEIDFVNKTFKEYLWIAGLKQGEEENFDKIEYLYITRSNVSQKLNSRVSSTTIYKQVYNGFLKFSETQKIRLFSEDNKEALLKKLKPISTKLNTEIIDRSE